MKKILLIMFVMLASVYAIGQKSNSALPSLIQCGNTGTLLAPETMGAEGVVAVNPELDYMSSWVLPTNGATSGNARIPRNNTNRYQREQYLILPSEMLSSAFPINTLVTSLGWQITAAGVGTQTGTLNIWLMNTTDVSYTLGTTWTTAGFTQVYSNTSFTVPIAVGPYEINFNGTPFTYTGGGVYIAWEFINEAGTLPSPSTALTASCNSSLANLCFGYQGTTNGTTLAATAFRPSTFFGTTVYTDVVDLTNIYAQERAPLPYGSPTNIGVRVKNVSGSAATFDVTVTVKDATNTIVRHTATQTVTNLAGNSATIVNFPWSPANEEDINITAEATLAIGENWPFNNSKALVANVNNNLFSYVYSLTNHGGFGYGGTSGAGIFASKFHMNGAGLIPGANLFIANSATNENKTIYAVVLNSAGTIVAQSANYIITAADLGTNKNFTFPVPPAFVNEDFFVGLAQPTFGYYPVGTFSEIPARPNTFYIVNLAGGTPTPLTGFDLRYGIEAQVSAYIGVVPPYNFTQNGTGLTQVGLNWTSNPANNPVMVVYNTVNTFGSPVNGTAYPVGSTIPGGGTVAFNAVGSSFTHTGLSAGTDYYYQIFSVDGTNNYSSAVVGATSTWFNIPYSEDFDPTEALPVPWNKSTMTVIASHGTSGSNGLTENLYNAVPTVSGISPTIVLSANQCKVSFDYRIVNWEGYPATATTLGVNDKVEVQMSTNNGTSYSTIFTINSTNHVTSTSFVNKVINLSIMAGGAKFRFVCTWGTGDYFVDIDNFIVEELPLCSLPTNLAVSNIGTNSVQVSWANAPFVEIEYGAPGYTPGNGTLVSPVVNNPYTVTNLNINTTYDLYIRQDCGNNVVSPWVGPVTFTTLNVISIAPSPFDFGNVGVGASSASQVFTITNNGPATIIESISLSGSDAGQFALTNTNPPNLNFASGASITVSVVFSPTSTGAKSAVLNVAEPEVAPYTAALSGTGVCAAPTSLMASNLTTSTADLSWNANGTTAWDLEYGLFGFTPGTGTLVTGVTNPYQLTGLSEGLSYSFYVRAVCNGGNSAWSGPSSFTVPCSPATIPYSQNFDGVTTPNLPLCWGRYSSAANRPWVTSSSAGIGAHSAPNFVGVFYSSTAPKNEWLVSAPIQVNAGTQYVVKFWVEAPGYGGYPERLKLVMSSSNALASLQAAPILWDNPNLMNADYVQYTAPFSSATGGTFYFAWHAYTIADIDYIALDDISFEVVQPLAITGNVMNATCFQTCNGSIQTTTTGGVPPYTYIWSTGATTANISGLCAGSYSVTVYDALQSSAQTSFTVESPNDLTMEGTATNATCPGTNDGAVNINVTGGTAPYSFLWSNGATTQNIAGLAPGDYTVTVTDSKQCIGIDSWTVGLTSQVCDFVSVTGDVYNTVCYDALQVITVAGGVSTFTVYPSGSATFIAGQKISYLPGTKVISGGSMYGKIAVNGQYCSSPPTLPGVISGNEEPIPAMTDLTFFSLYPNPTSGNVTLVQKGNNQYENVRIEIYNINGARVVTDNIIGEKQHEIKTADLPTGIYFVKVHASKYVETIKLVKTR